MRGQPVKKELSNLRVGNARPYKFKKGSTRLADFVLPFND
jgi:hypothetical protein